MQQSLKASFFEVWLILSFFARKCVKKKTVKPFKTKVNIYRFHFYNLNFCVKGLLTSERKELKESRKFGG